MKPIPMSDCFFGSPWARDECRPQKWIPGWSTINKPANFTIPDGEILDVDGFSHESRFSMLHKGCYLVGGIPSPLKNMSSSVGMITFPIY